MRQSTMEAAAAAAATKNAFHGINLSFIGVGPFNRTYYYIVDSMAVKNGLDMKTPQFLSQNAQFSN